MDTARELTAHRVNGLNEALRVFVLDQPGQGGACHDYAVLVPWGCPDPEDESGKYNVWSAHMLSVKDQFDRLYEKMENNDMTKGDVFGDPPLEKYLVRGEGKKGFWLKIHGPYCAYLDGDGDTLYHIQRITFQNGPVKEAGYTGNSHEALLAILLDRMEHFQKGPYACHDNQMALDHLQGARLWLHKRTMDRVARSVEGTHQK